MTMRRGEEVGVRRKGQIWSIVTLVTEEVGARREGQIWSMPVMVLGGLGCALKQMTLAMQAEAGIGVLHPKIYTCG